jgi:hypothetical protein
MPLMGVTGMANLAVKVIDLNAACAWYEAAGATVTEPVEWENGQRADVQLGTLALTLFTKAIYEDACSLPDEGFLHPALFVDDLASCRAPSAPAGSPSWRHPAASASNSWSRWRTPATELSA